MPYMNRVSGGSARKFGFTRRVGFYSCNTHTSITTLNNTDKKCYYPSNYSATATTTQQQQGPGCYSGGDNYGGTCATCYGCCASPCAGCWYSGGGGCTCYTPDWQPCGVGAGTYGAYYINVNVTTYSCPVNSGIATVSGTTCVYPAAYNATFNP